MLFIRVALPSPLRRQFDYLPPTGWNEREAIYRGSRIEVPFGPRKLIGLVLGTHTQTDCDPKKLRRALRVLDSEPLLAKADLDLLLWASDYYLHPVGEVVANALPTLLRQGASTNAEQIKTWLATDAGHHIENNALHRSPRQASLLNRLLTSKNGFDASQLNDLEGDWRATMKRLIDKGLACCTLRTSQSTWVTPTPSTAPELNPAQHLAVNALLAHDPSFQVFLLHGVTGSGKTEVYLQVMEAAIGRGEQILLLVPEISLTPQTVARLSARLSVPVVALHSGLTDRVRLQSWLQARAGTAGVVIGTRSAVFTPMPRLGLIILDEEHDLSFKQHDGFRYCARDIAIVRAQHAGLPVILGTATPSLESLHNAQTARYQVLSLPERAGEAQAPRRRLIDVRSQALDNGLSAQLLASLREHVDAGDQAILFLNRRGYAPVMLCHDCGWMVECPRCDARMTVHARQHALRCHHCGTQQSIPSHCGHCGAPALDHVGQGTQRIEEALRRLFPNVGIARIDRDTIRHRDALEQAIDRVHTKETQILIGTQMLSKGHDFPGVTLVGIIDVDQGLFGSDFRASERMAQLITQVSGRAGRGTKPGEVLIQTHHPEHPLLQTLLTEGYATFCQDLLQERQAAELPPFSRQALLRAEATDPQAPLDFLQIAKDLAQQQQADLVELWGPVPAPMERRAGRYRAQLLLQASERAPLQQLLKVWIPQLEAQPLSRKVRWSLDVDPLDSL